MLKTLFYIGSLIRNISFNIYYVGISIGHQFELLVYGGIS